MVCLWCGQTVSRTGGRSVYGHVITNFSRKGRSLHFLTYGAPLASFARESSAINWSNNCLKELCETLLKRANSSTYSQKAPAVTWFGLFYFTCEEPGTVQKEIELWDSFKGPNRSHWLLQGWAGNWVKIRYRKNFEGGWSNVTTSHKTRVKCPKLNMFTWSGESTKNLLNCNQTNTNNLLMEWHECKSLHYTEKTEIQL